jgi:hypothetical protein
MLLSIGYDVQINNDFVFINTQDLSPNKFILYCEGFDSNPYQFKWIKPKSFKTFYVK